jgi:prevent-host-death family protein
MASTTPIKQIVNIYEAKTQLSKLVDLAAAGQDIVIARNGKPVARLTGLETKQNRLTGLGALEGKGWIADDFDDPLPEEIQKYFEGREDDE